MNRELFKITIDGIKGRKKISILFVIIFTVSFAFGIITLSITSSMNQTNEQYRMNTYGAWSSAVKFSEDDPVNAYNGKVILPEWAENYGSITICAKLQTDSGDEYIGTMDEAVKDVGKIEMVDGRMPQGNDEVAMEADVLSELGYDYTLGAAGTWLILRFALAENIADVKLYIPHKQLLVMALLWTVGIMIARMVINIAALRQPLTGKMYPVGKRAKGIMILKKAMILQLSVLLCFVMIFGIFESLYPYSQMEHWNNLPSYKIYSGNLTGTDCSL